MISPAFAMTRLPVALLPAFPLFSSCCDRSDLADLMLRFELDTRDLDLSPDLERDRCLADFCRVGGDFEALRWTVTPPAFGERRLAWSACDDADVARCDDADF